MELREIGEFGLIQRFGERFMKKVPQSIVGIGDDCAVIPARENISSLITTDLLVENVHFLRLKISPFDLGYKSLSVNLSDIAAMGGVPRYAFLSIALPKELSVEWVDDFFDGFYSLCEQYQVLLLGGDTTKSQTKIIINVTVVGECENKNIKLRSNARIGDFICVTDNLGDSGAGAKTILEGLNMDSNMKTLLRKHFFPRPQIEEGRWLGGKESIHAMIDISDGLGSDIKHVIESSNCGADIFLDQLPLSEELQNASRKFHWDPLSFAVTAGEDYCLLLTVAENDYAELNRGFSSKFGKPLYYVGKITPDVGQVRYLWEGNPSHLYSFGFDHFKR